MLISTMLSFGWIVCSIIIIIIIIIENNIILICFYGLSSLGWLREKFC